MSNNRVGRNGSAEQGVSKGAAKRKKSGKQTVGRVALGTAAAAAVYLGSGQAAEAGIKHFGGPANSFTVTGAESYDWDIDGSIGYGVDFAFSATTVGTVYLSILRSFFTSLSGSYGGRGLVKNGVDTSAVFRNLAPGLRIGPALASNRWGTASYRTVTSNGALVDAKGFSPDINGDYNGYIGFRFDADAGAAEALRYGWARITIVPANDSSHSLTVHEWAYEDTGAGINIGALPYVGAVPEPGSAALLGLGLLAGGIAGVRRWRREKGTEKGELARS